MRWLLRLVLTWAVLMPVTYFWGLPAAANYLQAQTRQKTLEQCAQQLQSQGMTGGNAPLIGATEGDHYCHCLADPLTFTRADILALARQIVQTGQRTPPARLAAQLTAQVTSCNVALQQAIRDQHHLAPAVAPGTEILMIR